jgi:hypothetical protein
LNAVGWAEPVKARIPPFPAISQRRENTTFKNFKPFKQFKTIIGLFGGLNDWNDWNDLNASVAT